MRYTLLELVKSILRSMESDEVSDIFETQEAIDVADIVKECYFDIVGELNMAEQRGLFRLDASGDNLKPTLMLVPSTVSNIDWLKYDNSTNLTKPDTKDLTYVSNEEFIARQTGLDPNDTNIGSMSVPVNNSTFVFRFRKDRFPQYYTIFDDYYVVFDAIDLTVETTLTNTRSMGSGALAPSFTISNTFVPDLDPRQFQLLLQEAKATAFVELKQAPNQKAEAKARKNRILAQKNKYDNDPSWSGQARVGFGRRSPGLVNPQMKRAMRQGS